MNNLFDEDFCEQCGSRVPTDTLEENNEHWYCIQCTKEIEEESEIAEQRYQEACLEQMREEARKEDAVEEHYRRRYLPQL